MEIAWQFGIGDCHAVFCFLKYKKRKKELTEETVYDIITELSQISDRKKQCFILIVRK